MSSKVEPKENKVLMRVCLIRIFFVSINCSSVKVTTLSGKKVRLAAFVHDY